MLPCPESNSNVRDITFNLVEVLILHEIFRVVSRFPRYISRYIAESRLPLRQCTIEFSVSVKKAMALTNNNHFTEMHSLALLHNLLYTILDEGGRG